MREFEVNEAGAVGLAPDMPYHEIPRNAWSSGQNVRMRRGVVAAFPGEDLGSEAPGLAQVQGLFPVSSISQHFWVQVGDDSGGTQKAFAFDGSTYHDISPVSPFLGTPDSMLTACTLNQNLIVNNQEEEPHYWDLNTGNDFTPLTAWNAAWTAGAICAHKGFLLALDVTKSGTRYPLRVKWSDEAQPGGLPSSWDETDPTVLAGEADLADASGFLQTGLNLRNELVLYTENDCIGFQLVGGDLVWRPRTISNQAGALSRRSVVAFRGRHVVLTDQDVVLNDGQNPESIIDRRFRRQLFNTLDEDNYDRAFLVLHRAFNEIWVCYPTQGSAYCDTALVWNWRDNTWATRDLPEGTLAAAPGLDIVGLTTDTWDGLTGFTWDTIGERAWDARTFNRVGGLLLIGAADTAALSGAPVFRAEQGIQYNGADRTARVERLGLFRDTRARNVTVREVWPRVSGGPVDVWVGTQEKANGPVSWKAVRTYDPETDTKVTMRATGKHICVAFEGTSGWQLQGYLVKYTLGAPR